MPIPKYILNPDQKHLDMIEEGIKKKDGHCPCMIEISDDTLCPCKWYREDAVCHCKKYVE